MKFQVYRLFVFGLIVFSIVLIAMTGNLYSGSIQSASAAPRSAPYSLYLPIINRNYRYVASTVFGTGLEGISSSYGLNQMADAGANWVRSNNILSWASVEPAETLRLWNTQAGLEQELQNAASSGVKVILVVRQTPSWAQELSGYTCGPILSDKFGAFANFMHDAALRYSAPPFNVKYWEIWNEPDVDYRLVSPTSDIGCWGNQDDVDGLYGGGYYGWMLQSVYPQIKAADPQAQVLVGGLLLDCDPNNPPLGKDCTPSKFLKGILANNGGPYFDGVSFHAYDYYGSALGNFGNSNWNSAWNGTGPSVNAKANFLKGVLSAYGFSNKFLMNTESALLCDSCASDSTFETTKAYFLVQEYTGGIAQGLRANLWYTALGWRNSGLLNPDLSPRTAYVAYKFARQEILDSTFVANIGSLDVGTSGVAGYKFNRGDRLVWVLWSHDGATHTMSLSGVPYAAWDALGASLTRSSSMTVDLKPIYLEW